MLECQIGTGIKESDGLETVAVGEPPWEPLEWQADVCLVAQGVVALWCAGKQSSDEIITFYMLYHSIGNINTMGTRTCYLSLLVSVATVLEHFPRVVWSVQCSDWAYSIRVIRQTSCT